ncbi:S-layer homology domain-containing protein [Paenibacillus koleovorans]|uniref:S-layer homology domain-containing protein n=1 Tax=Paenibacillus koleovorans TaxID=121608 RepID=UPI000FDB585D|nr:S-layer homology domain-containing protein [Paenibacillus koleovorans]
MFTLRKIRCILVLLSALLLAPLIAPAPGLAVAPPLMATLHVIKQVINDNGSLGTPGIFTLHVKDSNGNDVPGSPAPGAASPGTTYILPAGTYVVSEELSTVYSVSYSGDFDHSGGNVVTLNAGDNKTVVVINDDLEYEGGSLATLYVIKKVINNNGGTAIASDFKLHVQDTGGKDVVGSPASGVESPGKKYTLAAGVYRVSEAPAPGYTVSYSGNLNTNGTVTLSPGSVKTVIVTNDDNATPFPSPTVTPTPTGSPTPTATPKPTPTPSPSPTVSPTPTAKPTSTPASTPTGSPSPTPTPATSPSPTPPPGDEPARIEFPYGYINGYDTGAVGVGDPLTREQVAASLYRIFKQAGTTDGYMKPTVSDFTDLETDRWSFAAIEYMVSIGAIPKGVTVRPTEPVTRGEMAKIIAMSHKMTDKASIVQFPDLPASHYYFDYVNMIVNYGLLQGYPDGTIQPDGLITRAEYITMVNRFIGRDARYNVQGYPSLYNDLDYTHWAFADIQRASFGFTSVPDENGFFQVDLSIDISKADLDT